MALALIFFSSVTIECVVDGPSMQPTLNVNWSSKNDDEDVVYVNKYDRDFAFGDIVVINAEDGHDHIIKRVIGVGGDKIDVLKIGEGENIEYKLEINGKIISEEYIKIDYSRVDISQRDGNYELYREFNDMKEKFPNLFKTFTIDGQEVQKLVVPKGEVFALGDNRHNSKDSTYYGTFKVSQLDGTVEAIRYYGESEFIFYWNYIVKGKFIGTIVNCF